MFRVEPVRFRQMHYSLRGFGDFRRLLRMYYGDCRLLFRFHLLGQGVELLLKILQHLLL